MNIRKMNKRELEDMVQELLLENKELTVSKDFWRDRYNQTRGVLDDHLNRLGEIEK